MGQKRTHNILDKEIGQFIANFEKRTLNKLDGKITDRLDKVIEGEKALESTIKRSLEITETNRQFVEKYEMKTTLNHLLAGALGGAIGAMVVVLCLVWAGYL